MIDIEARRILIQDMESLKANPLVTVDDCLYEALDKAINALGQGDVLDKIRAEVVDAAKRTMNDTRAEGLYMALRIIDKYKAESEDKE